VNFYRVHLPLSEKVKSRAPKGEISFTQPVARASDKPETRSPWWCPAHGYGHGERQPDDRPDCWVELPHDVEGLQSTSVRLTPHTEAEPWPIAQVFDPHRWSEA
jgi:hypothetical protein